MPAVHEGPVDNMTSGSVGQRPRIVELDALRGIAALAVTVFHYTTHYGHEIGHVTNPSFGFSAGNYGVQLFFLISGFVILMTLERTKTAMDFVVSRFSRLFPMYWAAIVATTGVIYFAGLPGQQFTAVELLANLTMIQEILGFEHLDGSYWTLQIEFFFYAQMLLWFSLGLLPRIRWIVLGWLAVAMIFAFYEKFAGKSLSYTLGSLLIAQHIPFFGIGVLFYRTYSHPDEARGNYLIIAAAVVVIALTRPLPYTGAALAGTAVFWLFVSNRLGWLRLAPLAYLGTISYSLYLLHQVIGYDLLYPLEHRGVSGDAAVLLTIIALLALSSLLTYTVERPALKAIRAWWKNRKSLRVAPSQ